MSKGWDAGRIREEIALEMADYGPWGSLIPAATWSRLTLRVRRLARIAGMTIQDVWSSIELDVNQLTGGRA